MMTYDEPELIEFFGVLPSEQNPEEKEFFGTTIFDYCQGHYHLSISFSIYRNDFYLDLKDIEISESIIELRLDRVQEIRVRRDKAASMPALIVRARCSAEDDEKEVIQTTELRLEPNICIKIGNQYE